MDRKNENQSRLLDWSARLRFVASLTLHENAVVEAFSDAPAAFPETHLRLLAWRQHRDSRQPIEASVPQGADIDAELWRALVDPEVDPMSVLIGIDASRSDADRDSLIPMSKWNAIEVWTETELASLHALWWIARLRGDAALRARVDRAAHWHLEHTQPDNATNRPWAIHVFAGMGIEGNQSACHLAESMLHNCRVTTGRPDALSALILLDAADALEYSAEVTA